MRFPELSLTLAKMGADILTFPSAFTFATGAVHWETLLRARAIESQCYVVAAAQTGTHNNKRSSWGHAMVSNSCYKINLNLWQISNIFMADYLCTGL
jgi:predicted amidohydrolase